MNELPGGESESALRIVCRRAGLALFGLGSCVVFCAIVLHVRSFWNSDIVNLELPPKYGLLVESRRGVLWIFCADWNDRAVEKPLFKFDTERHSTTNASWLPFDFQLLAVEISCCDGKSVISLYWFPIWVVGLLGLLLSAPSLTLFARNAIRQLHGEGTCRTCGYDLRATPERCPECGTRIARQARNSNMVVT